MLLYLPIAGVPVNALTLFSLGGVVGLLSGIFGVGGGFVMTPLLISLGIPSDVAVGTVAAQVAASSMSGVLVHWRRRAVDVRMGLVLLVGGALGSTGGVGIFSWLRGFGQIDFAIKVAYVFFLGTVGLLMLWESVKCVITAWKKTQKIRRLHDHTWLHNLPLKVRFRKSRLYISLWPPFLIGVVVGLMSSVLGVGGGFIVVPAMIYLLGMPTTVVVGTSLFQIVFVMVNATFLQAYVNQTVDLLLVLVVLLGSVVGAQIGARVGGRVRGDYLRLLLASLVLGLCADLFAGLIVTPHHLYNLHG